MSTIECNTELFGTKPNDQKLTTASAGSINGVHTQSHLHQTATNKVTITACKGLHCNQSEHAYSHCILGLIIGIVSIVSVMVLVIATGTWTLVRQRVNKMEGNVKKKWIKELCKPPNNQPVDV